MKINWSIKLGVGALILMVFGWIVFPSHTLKEWFQFFCDLLAIACLFAVLWFVIWRTNCIIKYTEEQEHKQMVADKVEARRYENIISARAAPLPFISTQEMRANAESFLTQDQKAHLYMVSKNPQFKIDTKA